MTARSSYRPVLLALVCATLAASVGGCGRKGPLDLPPQAQSKSQAQAQVAPVEPAVVADEEDNRGPGSVIDRSLREPEPVTPRGGKRKFILDPLLGD